MLAFNKSLVRRLVGVLVLVVCLALAAWLKFHFAWRQTVLQQNEPARSNSFKPFASLQLDGIDARTFLAVRVAYLFDYDQFPSNEFRTNKTAFPIPKSMGCAAAIDGRGYFLTAAHCVEAKDFRLVLRVIGTNGMTNIRIGAPWVVWRGDRRNGRPDLAILRVKRPLDRVFDLADDIHKNDPVMAVGMLRTILPGSSTFEFLQPSLAMEFMGGKVLDWHRRAGNEGGVIVTTDVPLQPGDSGGPLLDVKGRLVGIDTELFYPPTHWLLPGGFLKHSEHPDWKWVSDIIEKDYRDSAAGPKQN